MSFRINFFLTISLVLLTLPLFPEVSVAVFSGADPMIKFQENGSVSGFFPEVLKSIFEGKEEIRFVLCDSFQDAYERVVAGELDLLPAAILTEERQKVLYFNKEPFMVSWSEVFVAPHVFFNDIFDLKRRKIALMQGGQNGKNFLALMENLDIPFEPVYFESFTDMTDAVLSGNAAAMVSYSFFNSGGKLTSSGIVFSPTQSYVATGLQGRNDLFPLIDQTLAQYKRSENSVLYRQISKWLHYFEVKTRPKWIKPFILISSSFLLVALFLILFMRLQVEKSRNKLLKNQQEFEEALANADLNYRTIADYNYNWEYWLTPEGDFIYCSPSCCDCTGYKAEEFKKDKNLLNQIIHPDSLVDWQNHNSIHRGVHHGYYKIVHKSGKIRWLEHQCRHIEQDGTFLGHRGSFRDVTSQKDLEEEVNQIRKMQSLGRLAGGVAHDLNNLLTPILGYADILEHDQSLGQREKKFLEKIIQAGQSASGLVKKLLLFSRKEEVHYKTENLNSIIRNFIRLLDRTLKENITLSLDLDDSLDNFKADKGQIEQIILNLCVNSQDVMPEGGTLNIRTFQKEGNLFLEITDTGSGISRENLPHIFEPFFTTKGTSGTGLGLSTVYGIINKHNGTVDVDSKPGEGTRFLIGFPSVSGAVEPTPGEPEDTPAAGENSRLLIVEDNRDIQKLLKEGLTFQGFQIDIVANAEEAIEQIHRNRYALVISDVIMPGKTGLELYKSVQELNKDQKFLFISGHSLEYELDGMNLRNSSFYLQKPFSIRDITRKIHSILNSKV